MICPKCQAQGTTVLESRASADARRRRRECPSCGHRFTTSETLAYGATKSAHRPTRAKSANLDFGFVRVDPSSKRPVRA